MADWSNLPCDTLGEIALKLDTLEDFIYFSIVCHLWNYASSLVKHQRKATNTMPPWLLLAEAQADADAENTNNNETPKYLRKIYNLFNNRCYQSSMPQTYGSRCWGSSYGWVVVLTIDFTVCLFNPLSKQVISTLPSIQNLPKSPFIPDDTPERYWKYHIKSILVLKMAPTNELLIAVLYEECYNYLALARPGDQSWLFIDEDVEWVESCGNLIYMVNSLGKLSYFDYNNGIIFDNKEAVEVFEYLPAIKTFCWSDDKIYLLNCGDDLLMVTRDKYDRKDENLIEEDETFQSHLSHLDYSTVEFEVFKIDSKDKKWVQIENFGNFSLFLGCNSTFSVPVSLDNNLRSNCIYFTDDEKFAWERRPKSAGRDMGIYDIKTGDVTTFYHANDDDVFTIFCPPIFFVLKY